TGRSRKLCRKAISSSIRRARARLTRESLPEQFTIRLQGGNFNTGRGFFAFSPDSQRVDAYLAYEGSYTDGPFQSPGRYRRDNFNGNYTRTLGEGKKIGFRLLLGRNNFYSSGQVPLDL